MDIKLPMTKAVLKELRAGDSITVSGILYTARDAAHAKMVTAIDKGEMLPIEIENQLIYYVGPCPSRPGEIIGSCGPTTSYRMDLYAPRLIEMGLGGMIGKGSRSEDVKSACVKYGCVYFGAIGGAGALLASHVKNSEVVAYDELGTEAIRKLEVDKFPLTVIIDSLGNDLYEMRDF